MGGVLVSLLIAIGLMGLAHRLLKSLWGGLDPASQVGIAGLIGLGGFGTVSLFIGLFPGGVGLLPIVGGLLALAGWYFVLRGPWWRTKAETGTRLPFALGLAVIGLTALVGVVAPSDTLDWDSIAYHLAAAKLWMTKGQIVPISFMHHSNFPLSVDALFMTGLKFGEPGAKAFSFIFGIFGCTALFGLGRQQYGAKAGWWAALSFATIPTVLWEAGTAYIDMAHGLFAGLGAILILTRRDEKGWLWLGAILLGLAAGSKYTGLQVLLVTGIVLAAARPFAANLRASSLMALVALAVAAPWYIKNVAWVGNPVYPFFYEKLGGKNWSEFNAKIYKEEQDTFGLPKAGPLSIGPSILGLVYQPGRYTNPAPALDPTGPSGAQGMPIVAFGAALFCGGLAWAFSGISKADEKRLLSWVLLSFLVWAMLSQQARYAIAFAPPLALLLGAGITRLRVGPLLAVVAVAQAGYSLWLIKTIRLDAQLPVVLGQQTRDEYLGRMVGFYQPSQAINRTEGVGRVALYDEVFGYFLDVPYSWANPGHSMELDYATISTAADMIAAYGRLGITHVYLNLALTDPETADRMIRAMGMTGSPEPYSRAEATSMSADPRTKWRLLVAQAVASGQLRVVQTYRKSVLFAVANRG